MAITSPPSPAFTGPAVTTDNGYIVQSLDKLSQEFDVQVGNLNNRVQKALEAVQLNPSNAKALADYQSALGDYTTYRGLQSGSVKAWKDMATEIIRNF